MRSSTYNQAISRTALGVAAKRAIEHERPDRLFDDPFAALLAGNELSLLLNKWQQVGDKLSAVKAKRTRFVALRTRLFDDFIKAALPHIEQVVILGAGMDARAYRMPWRPGIRLFEIDRPEIFAYKDAVLSSYQPTCDRRVVACDLSENWVSLLLTQGYQVDRPSLWLLEGLLMYFTPTQAHELLRTVSNLSIQGSYLAIDLVSLQSLDVEGERVRQHWQFGTDEPEELLASYGWSAHFVQPGEPVANFGRYEQAPPPRDRAGERRVFIATAIR